MATQAEEYVQRSVVSCKNVKQKRSRKKGLAT